MAEKRVDVAYDAASQYATIARYADLAGTDLVATATYVFDDAYRLIGLDYAKGETTLSEYAYTYDAAGNMTSMTTVDGAVDYTSDDTGQLTDADYDYQTDESYSYDENGNRLSYTTGENNQLLFDGTYTYEYDAEGNRTRRYIDVDQSGTLSTGDTDITFYRWDHRNRLIQVDHTYSVLISGTPPLQIMTYDSDMIVDYVYDAFDRLVKREYRSGSYIYPETRDVYVYAVDQIAFHFYTDESIVPPNWIYVTAEDLVDRYLWNPQAVDQLLADEQVHWDDQQEEFVTDELLWALTDHLGSVRDLATYDPQQDETTIALHRVFDAFGNETSSTGTAVCIFGYTGRLFDEYTQLQNNWRRWYDPTVGKFISEDPLSFFGGDANLYRYVGNNPLRSTDPTGLEEYCHNWRGKKDGKEGYFYQWEYWDSNWFGLKFNRRYGPIQFIADDPSMPVLPFNQVLVQGKLGVGGRPGAESDRSGIANAAVQVQHGGTVAVVVGSIVLPGPDDVVCAAVLSKFGVRALWRGGKWILTKGGREITEAEAKTFAAEIRAMKEGEKAAKGASKGAKAQNARLPKPGTPERAAIEAARARAIRAAQARELANIRAGGRGSGVWTDAELTEIRKTGRFPEDVTWHHDPTVANRPDLADNPSVIRPIRGGRQGHLNAHGGDWRKP